MPTFEFTGGVLDTSTGATGTGVFGFTDGGVNFTFSYNSAVTLNLVGHEPGVSGGHLIADASSNGPIILTLDVTGPGGATGFSGPMGFNFTQVAGTWQIQAVGTTVLQNHTHTSFNVPIYQTIPAGNYSHIVFTFSGFDPAPTLGLNDISAGILCFAEGTRIATAGGEKRVEDLTPGDRLRRADGGLTEMVWLGRRRVNAQLEHPAKINPVCITAGAIEAGVPSRDLLVSPDHAVMIDGLLINASALVNGRTIYPVRDMPLDGFTYYHVETEAHDVILAEGCPAESYIDNPNRDAFDNGAERTGAPMIAEMEMPRISSSRLLPESIRARLGIAESGVDWDLAFVA